MADLKLYANTQTDVDLQPITAGQMLFTTDLTHNKQYLDKDASTRVEIGGVPVDTALSTTSTNPIANNAITNSIINTTAEVSAITADNIPCGTKPVKELITNLNAPTVGQFIYDYQNGSAGYNTSPTRGADTFHPFKNADSGNLSVLSGGVKTIVNLGYQPSFVNIQFDNGSINVHLITGKKFGDIPYIFAFNDNLVAISTSFFTVTITQTGFEFSQTVTGNPNNGYFIATK